MAVVNVDLGSSDRTIDGSVAQNGDTLNITALGSHTLTIDGVSIAISNIASITSGAALTVTTVNGASLLFDQGLLNGNLLSSLAFEVNDTSSISFDSGSVSVLSPLLSDFSVSFNGTEDGSFEYEPAGLGLLSDVNVDVSGMESHDQLTISSRNNLQFSYDSGTQTGIISSAGTLGLTPDVSFNISGMTQGQADVIAADIADVDVDLWVTNDTIIMPVCLAAGTRILTTRGERAIENLAVGDLVVTADRGAVPIRWIGSSTYLARDFAVDPRHLPIRIKAGCLGNDVPSRDLVVSPQHRILLASKVVERMFANDEILVPAKRLLGLPGVEVMRSCREVIYMHLLFDEHEVFFAEHTPVESLLMGPMAMRSFSREQVEEIESVFPELVGADTVPASARPMPQAGRANRLVKRYLKNEMQPLEL